MSLLKQLTRWKIRGQIDQDVIDIILTLQSRLEHHWRIDVSIPTVITLLLHIANSLARLKRGGCVSPLHQAFYDEMQSAVIFLMFWKFTTICFLLFRKKFPKPSRAIISPIFIACCWSKIKNKGTKAPILSVKNQTEF